MKFIVSLAFSDSRTYCRLARAAEAAGFAAVAVSDHIIHPRALRTPYPYTDDGKPRWEPFTDWPDPWVAIGAMAAVTERLRFLTSVFVLPMRNPFAVAKAVATAAVMSDDRVALGIGTGWMEQEFEAMEQRFARRGRRTDEMIEVLRKLWAGGWVEHHGEHYDFDELEMSPPPAREIPIYGGGISKRALRRAAMRCDGWVADFHSIDEAAELIATLRALRADGPRAERPLEVIAALSDAFDLDGYRRAEEAGVTQIITQPWFFYPGGGDSLEAKADSIARFGDDVAQKLA